MKYYTLLTFVLFLSLTSCQKDQTIDFDDEEVVIDWSEAADKSTSMLLEQFWNSRDFYFNYDNGGNTDFHYWPNAHGLNVILDAYERTKDDYYKTYTENWYVGVPRKNGNGWLNHFYDDMEWNIIALMRAYHLFNDQKYLDAAMQMWNDTKNGWTAHNGGGINWNKDQNPQKGACSNGPAAIIAARLYQITKDPKDLEWAKKIYEWQQEVLVNPNTGAVWDHIKYDGAIQTSWLFTYNQGTYLGAAYELFKITGETHYLNEAIKATNFTLSNLINANDGLLKDEGAGDGGIFKGIFVRYFVQMIMDEKLPEPDRQKYLRFLKHNGEVAWLKGRNDNTGCYSSYWNKKPEAVADYTSQLSACMLMEGLDLLQRKGFIDAK